MARPIVVGYDPRTRERGQVRFAVAIARLAGARLVIAAVDVGSRPLAVSAGQTLPYAVELADADLVADGSDALAELEQELEAEGITAEYLKLPGDTAARVLHETAETEDAGLLVVGSPPRDPAERVLLGSTAERLLHGSPCPITVVPHGWSGGGIETIGAAYADTPDGREALRGAYALARRAGATLRVLTVVKPRLVMYSETEAVIPPRPGKDYDHVVGEHRAQAEAAARRAVAALAGEIPIEVDAFVGDPAKVLAELSGKLGLLVCGSRGYGPLRAVLLGSVSRQLVTEARCPVMVLPRGVESALESLLEETATAI
jgi:nucleotide-binding universal stress UspA family protein